MANGAPPEWMVRHWSGLLSSMISAIVGGVMLWVGNETIETGKDVVELRTEIAALQKQIEAIQGIRQSQLADHETRLRAIEAQRGWVR